MHLHEACRRELARATAAAARAAQAAAMQRAVQTCCTLSQSQWGSRGHTRGRNSLAGCTARLTALAQCYLLAQAGKWCEAAYGQAWGAWAHHCASQRWQQQGLRWRAAHSALGPAPAPAFGRTTAWCGMLHQRRCPAVVVVPECVFLVGSIIMMSCCCLDHFNRKL